jgi:hypothetical protein
MTLARCLLEESDSDYAKQVLKTVIQLDNAPSNAIKEPKGIPLLREMSQ